MGNRFIPDRDTPTGSGADPTSPREREFDAGENITIGGLAFWMGLVGMVGMVGGTLRTVFGLLAFKTMTDVVTVCEGVLAMVVGSLLWSASRSFKQIVQTNNNDIGHLMTALGKLRTVYTIQGVVMIATVVLVVVAFLLLLGGTSHTSVGAY